MEEGKKGLDLTVSNLMKMIFVKMLEIKLWIDKEHKESYVVEIGTKQLTKICPAVN